jgi:hypothetical protein
MMLRSDAFMASGQITNPRIDQPGDLKQAFEAAVQELDGEKTSRAKRPIYPRKQALFGKSEPDQKRALEDAADALAAIWKTSGKTATRPNPRRNEPR